ncbi:MAG: hypothetical protein JJU16_10265 [Alkalibacterium sp.]|nr:hypothetical protein [Alkalibacterium sp.]
MSKKNVRLLAAGFLFSGVLILLFSFLDPAETAASNQKAVEALEAEISYLEDLTVSLELENELLLSENTLLAQQFESLEDTELDSVESQDSETTEETEETASADDNEETDEEEDAVTERTEYTVVVNEGEPSSVVAAQLENYGLIDDYHGFNRYMEENDLFRRLRPGNYTVHSDMTRDQMIGAIIR